MEEIKESMVKDNDASLSDQLTKFHSQVKNYKVLVFFYIFVTFLKVKQDLHSMSSKVTNLEKIMESLMKTVKEEQIKKIFKNNQ